MSEVAKAIVDVSEVSSPEKKQIQVSTGKYKVGTHLSLVTVLVLFTSSSLIHN